MAKATRYGCVWMIGVWALTLALPAVPAQAAPVRHAVAQAAATFQTAACGLVAGDSLPAGLDSQSPDLVCGYLTVPTNHDDPTGPTLELAVVIVQSQAASPAPDPVVMLQGGPGGSAIDTFLSFIFLADSPLRANRDLILLEQRGTLRSDPFLDCVENDDLLFNTIEEDLSLEDSNRLSFDASLACLQRLKQNGVDVNAFDSFQNARDIESLRQALGLSEINLYGVSYGTALALHAMRLNPGALRSVVLDAVVPPQLSFIADIGQSQQRAFEALFDGCAADPACNRAYPNLRDRFYALVAAWNAAPVRIPLTNPEDGQTYQAVFSGDALINVLFQFLYFTEILPALPHLIEQAERGDYALLSTFYAQAVFDQTFSSGMYNAVVCAEDGVFDPATVNLAGLPADIERTTRLTATFFAQVCAAWAVEPLPASAHEPVTSAIPTLVLSGHFDPITPPANGDLVAQTLSQAYVYTFPDVGHGAALGSECAAGMVLAFWDDPTRAPDDACLRDAGPLKFFTPETIRFDGLVLRLFTASRPQDGGLLLFWWLMVAGLASAGLVWPVMGLVRWLKPGPAYAPVAAVPLLVSRLSVLVTVLSHIVLAVGWLVGVVMLVANNDFVLYIGYPASMAWLFALLWLALPFTLLMGALAVWRWWAEVGGVWSRTYYAFLVLCAFGAWGAALALGLVV